MIIHAPKVNGPNPDKQPSCRLFQLSDPALLKIFENQFNKSNGDITPAIPKPLVFKGSPDDEVILCTEDVTFQVRDVHTSNNFMLLAPLKNIDNSYRVIHQSSTYLETLRFPGHLESLRLRLLNSIPYYPHLDTSEPHINSNDFPINFESNSSSPHVMPSGKGSKDFQDDMLLEENILDSVQASDLSIIQMLHSLNAIRVDGYWRLPSTDYSRLFLRHLFASINSLENFQFTNSIPASLILDHFGNQNQIFPFNVVLQLLKIYGGSETPLEQFTLNVEKVCQFYARVILQIETRSKEYIPLTPFMIKWQQALIDDGCEASPTALMLRGIAIVEPAPAALGGGRVYRFESSELPITGDPAPILARLFAARPRWELASMEPYLESVARLLGPKTKAADLIVKHARISVDPNTGLKIVTPLINAL